MSLDWLEAALTDREAAGLLRTRRRVVPTRPGWCEIEGVPLLNFAANDYLGLAGDERLRSAALEALRDSGTGARASALVTGRTAWHHRLEERLAEFCGTAAALLFPTGYAANVGTVAALVRAGDVVLCDRLNHASLVDGCRLSGAQLRVFPHRDVGVVERELQKARGAPRRLVTTDSIFSMDGDAAPLRELADICERHDAMLLVDEAHATGVYGERGRGLLEEAGVQSPAIIKVGTLSKALGCQGGFVAGSQALIDWLYNTARPQMFSTALAPAACAAALAALEIVRTEPERRQRVRTLAEGLRQRLIAAGLEVGGEPSCPIIVIPVGSPERVLELAARLERRQFLVASIRPPTVPRGTSRLRISLSAVHEPADVEALGEAVVHELASLPAHTR